MCSGSHFSRRGFLKSAAAVTATICFNPAAKGFDIAHRGDWLEEFDYADVRLTDGPLKDHYDRILASYLSIDNDRMLKVYRQHAGLPAPGEDMGGWYNADGFVPGHSLGQYISGLARYARATGETLATAKVNALVSGFAEALNKNPSPFASKIAATTWPCYIVDKHAFGLLDAYRLTGNKQALALYPRVMEGAMPFLPDHTYDRGPNSPKQAPYDETYILSENLFNAFDLTGDRRWLELAKKYLLNTEYYVPLSTGENILPSKHAYSHVISLSSAARAYEELNDPMYFEAIRNAWEMLETTQQYASGGWGPKEAFVTPHEGKLYESLASTGDHFETPCGYFAQSKLARYLLRFTGEARYGDGLERVLYNTILGAKDPDGDGNYFYYSNYHPLAQKSYYQKKWPCCSGTLIQGVADHVLNLYFRRQNDIYVNLYSASEVRWRANGIPIKMIQTTHFPFSDSVQLRLEMPTETEFTIFLRIPQWVNGTPSLAVNGKDASTELKKQTFASVRRRWRNGDTLELTLPFGAKTEAIDDKHPETVAVMYGPLMMVSTTPPAGIANRPLAIPEGLRPLAHATRILEYDLPGQSLQFRPWFTIQNERYNTYHQLARRRV